MNARARSRRTVLLAAVLLALGAACGTEPESRPTPQLANDTPQNTILSLVQAYEGKRCADYAALFTGDFTFEFSIATDPELASRWSTGWFAGDESLAAQHLFSGGYNREGEPVPAALSIDFTFGRTLPVEDTEGRDPARYQMLSTPVEALVTVPSCEPDPGPNTLVIARDSHRFFLVRGDAALGLTARQPADSLHWYVWRWIDETVPRGLAPAGDAVPTPTQPLTWGKLKSLFR